MRRFLKRLVFGKREHDHRLVTFARDYHWRVVLTNPVDRVRKVLSRLSVSDRLHVLDRIPSSQRGAIRKRSDRLQEFAHVVMVASRKEKKDTRIGAENQPNLQTYTAFKVISAQPPDANAGMKMW